MAKKKKIKKVTLDEYLNSCGCELVPLKSEWEVARFSANGTICVVYQNSKGNHKFSNKTAMEFYWGWCDGIKVKLPGSRRRQLKKNMKDMIIARDGLICFYSGADMTKETATIEHLIPVCRGGKNTLENLVLCLDEENKFVADMPLIDKIKYRDEKLNEKNTCNPKKKGCKMKKEDKLSA